MKLKISEKTYLLKRVFIIEHKVNSQCIGYENIKYLLCKVYKYIKCMTMVKRRLLLILSILAIGLPFSGINDLNAQKIYGDFDRPWVEDAIGNGALPGMYLRPGTQPYGWQASNVNQKVLLEKKEILVTPDANRVGENGFSARMENKYLGVLGIGSNAPAYVTLGVPWVYAVSNISACGGGTLGGIEYTQRPDSLVGYYKRTLAEGSTEPALIRAYLWSGSCISTVPVNPGGGLSSTETRQVRDRDVCILGDEPYDEGNVTLIGKIDYKIENELDEWTRISIPVSYLTDDFPEKVNIIISSANYTDRGNIVAGNLLWADDIEFVYNTKLKSILLDGEEIPEYHEDIFDYQLPYSERTKELSVLSVNPDIVIVNISEEEEGSYLKKIIKVKCEETKGIKEYTYIVTFRGEPTEIILPTDAPTFVYGDLIENLGFTSNSVAPFTYTSSDEDVIKYDAESKELKIVGAGTAQVIAYQAGNETHASAVSQPLTVTVTPAELIVSLAEGAWCERGVNVSESNKNQNKCYYELKCEGLKYSDTPETIFTTAVKVTSNAPKEEEQVGDMRGVILSDGVAPNYEIKYASDQKLIITKTTLDVYVEYNGSRFNSDYEGENYHKIGAPLGRENHVFTLYLFGNKYSDTKEDILEELGDNAPKITCEISADTPLGTECPVRIEFPVTEIKNYKLNSKLPNDAVVVIKKELTFEYDSLDVTYGDPNFNLPVVPKLEPEEEAIQLRYSSNTTAIVSVGLTSGVVTIKKAGNAQIRVYTAETPLYAAGEILINFEVKKAPLTVNYENVSRIYGEENPEFEFISYEGFVKDETESVIKTAPVPSCDATVNSPVGDYPIDAIEGEADNYNFIGNGILTIAKASLSVTATDTIRNVGEENPEFKLEYDGFVNNENENTPNVFITMPTASCVADINSPVGIYDIIVIAGEALNYEITPKNGKMTVQQGSGINSDNAHNISVYSKDGILYIEGNTLKETAYIYNTQGAVIAQYNDETITVTDLSRNNLYIVKIGNFTRTVLLK